MDNLPNSDVEMRLVAGAIRRRWALILAIALAMTAGFGIVGARQAASYTSTTKVLLRPVPGNPLSPNLSNGAQVVIAVQTEAAQVNSSSVTKLVSAKLSKSVAAGSPAVKTTVPPNTQVIEIAVTDRSPATAQAAAQAFAETFLAYRAAQATSTQDYQLTSLKTQATAVEDNLKKATKAAASANTPADAIAQVQVYATHLASLQDSIGQLQSGKIDAGAVIAPAPLPATRNGIPRSLWLLAGAGAGLGLGLAFAIWRERKYDRVRVSLEPTIVGFPVLATLPEERREGPRHISLRGTDDALRNAYRVARVGITALQPTPGVIVVAAVGANLSSGPVASNLALSLASAGHRVVLIDATLNDNEMAAMLGADAAPGLSDLMSSEEADAPTLTWTEGIELLSGGSSPQSSRELLAGSRFADIIDRFRRSSDYVIIAAATTTTADGDAVALAGDGLVLVIRDQRTTHLEVRRAVERAEQLNVAVLGSISLPKGHRSVRHRPEAAKEVADRRPMQQTVAAAEPLESASSGSATGPTRC